MLRRLAVLAAVALLPAAPASALTAPTITNVSCGGTYASFYMTGGGGTSYRVYEVASTNAGDTWGTEWQVHDGGAAFLRVGLNPAKWHRFRAVAVDAGVEGPSTYQRCPYWRPASEVPYPDAQAVNYVIETPERVPANATANAHSPSDAELAAFYAAKHPENPYLASVTGRCIPATPTTSEILQCLAAKWGIPLDILKAMAQNESGWNQAAEGDCVTGKSQSYVESYPAQFRGCGGGSVTNSVFESAGLMQIKWRPDGTRHPGTEPLRWKSTAFNVDYTAAQLRFYYDGCTWCNPGYSAGQEWNSIGAHFNPSPWGDQNDPGEYVSRIKGFIISRPWGSY